MGLPARLLLSILIAAVWRLPGRWLWVALPVAAGLALLLLWQGGGL